MQKLNIIKPVNPRKLKPRKFNKPPENLFAQTN